MRNILKYILVVIGLCNTFSGSFAQQSTQLSGLQISKDNVWIGLDLGSPHIITTLRLIEGRDAAGESVQMQLGLFEGANEADFSDAVPLYIVNDNGEALETAGIQIRCGKGFRYVRYHAPYNCRNAEFQNLNIEYYGYPGEGVDNVYSTLTNLPVVVINTKNGEEPEGKEKSDEKESVIKIISPDGDLLSAKGTIRLRGNASMSFEKKPYRIKFDKKQRPLDAKAKAKKWTLINNYGDKTLMRNLVAWEISRLFDMEYVPYGRAVDLVVNGDYKGCYQLCDQIEVKEGRVPVSEVEIEDFFVKTPAECDYLMEIDGYAGYSEPYAVPENFKSDAGIPVTLKSPDPDDILEAGATTYYEYAKNLFQRMEDACYPTLIAGGGYRDLLDIDSFLKHLLIGEITCNPDIFWSTYIYKRAGDSHFYVGPEWDFDLAFDNDKRIHHKLYNRPFMYTAGTPAGSNDANGWGMKNLHTIVSNMLFADEGTLPYAKYLWEQAVDKGLTSSHLCDYIDQLASELNASQKLNFTRWDILDKSVHQNVEENLRGSYEEYVELLKEHVSKRLDYLYNKSLDNVQSDAKPVLGVDADIEIGNGCIIAPQEASVKICNVSGVNIYSGHGGSLRLPAGIYIVNVNGRSYKVSL